MGLDVVFISGSPGAGKTTVAEGYQSTHQNVDQFSTGDLVRGISAGKIYSKYSSILHKASERRSPMPDDIFSAVVRERIARTDDATDTVVITGFPNSHVDWRFFHETALTEDVHILGSAALYVGIDTSVKRMQERDIKNGVDATVVSSAEEMIAYRKRYFDIMARHAIRLDCYRQSGLSVVPISAERPRKEVLDKFTEAITTFKEDMRRNG